MGEEDYWEKIAAMIESNKKIRKNELGIFTWTTHLLV